MKTTRFACDLVIAAVFVLQFVVEASAQPGGIGTTMGAGGMPPGVPSDPKDRIEMPTYLLIETKNGLSAYSMELGKWDSVNVGLPKDGSGRLKKVRAGVFFASVIIDNQLFGYSSEAGRWARLMLPEEYVDRVSPNVSMPVLTVKIGEQTWALSPKTGEWISPDGKQASAPDEKVGQVDLTSAERKLSLAISTAESRKLTEAISELDAKAEILAAQIRVTATKKQEGENESPKLLELRRQLDETLSTTFDLKHQLEQLRVKELQSRLSGLEQQIGHRQGQRRQIIERRARELIEGEDTQWDQIKSDRTTRVDVRDELKTGLPKSKETKLNSNFAYESAGTDVPTVPPRSSRPPERKDAIGNPDEAENRRVGVSENISAIAKNRFAYVFKAIKPSVVRIQTQKRDAWQKNWEAEGLGVIMMSSKASGFFVVTNSHLIDNLPLDASLIQLHDGRITHPAKVWTDPESDIAVMRIEVSDLEAATWGDSRNVDIGDEVLAITNTGRPAAFGIIGARNLRQIKLGKSEVINQDFFQTNIPIQPGDSGGPLIDLNGKVIGINTAIARADAAAERVRVDFGLSISSHLAQQIVDQLMEFGQVRRAWIGVKLDEAFDINAANKLNLDRLHGAHVQAVFPNSPASRAGLQLDDVILKFDGTDVQDHDHLVNLVSLSPIGKEIEMTVWRSENKVKLTIVLADRSQLRNPTDLQNNVDEVPKKEVPKEAEKTPLPGEPMGQMDKYKRLPARLYEAREEILEAKDAISQLDATTHNSGTGTTKDIEDLEKAMARLESA